MALEDAVVLARSLGNALRRTGSIDIGFAEFEASRRKRVEKIVAQGARSSSSKTPGRVGSAVRDFVLRLVFRYGITEKSMSWMYNHRVSDEHMGQLLDDRASSRPNYEG